MMTILILRLTLVLAAALLADRLLRRAPALRHLLWTVTFAGLLLLPLLGATLPGVPLPGLTLPVLTLPGLESTSPPDASGLAAPARRVAPDAGPAATPTTHARDASSTANPSSPLATTARPPALPAISPTRVALALWLLGAFAGLGLLARDLRAEQRLRTTARPVADAAWQRLLATSRRELALRRPVRLLASAEVQTPMTGGCLRPAVLLPEEAARWPRARRAVVLRHELVHVRRYDWLRRLLTRVAVALYFFHPLVWLAARRAAIAREEACDAAVLGTGVRPSRYAGHLLEIAAAVTTPAAGTALPMAQPSHLETRIMAILDPRRRHPGRLAAAATVVLAAAVVLSTAAAQPGVPADTTLLPALPVAPAPGALAAGALGAQPDASPCAAGNRLHGSFSGSMSSYRTEGEEIVELVGVHDGDLVVMRRIGGGVRLCARMHGEIERDPGSGGLLAVADGAFVDVETRSESRGGGASQRLIVTGDAGGLRHDWRVDGAARPWDAAGQAWLDTALAVIDDLWAIADLRGEVGSLRGEIGSIHGEVGSLRGEIGSLHGERGSLHGEIGSIRGELGSLRGEAGSLRGEIGSLRARRWQASADERREIDAEIAGLEEQVAGVDAEIAGFDVEGKLAELEGEIAGLDVEGRVSALEAEIAALDADGRMSALEAEIAALDADAKIDAIERELEPEVERLRELVGEIR